MLIWSPENCFNTDVTRGVIVNSKCDRNHLAARLPVDPLGSLQCSPDPVLELEQEMAGKRGKEMEREGRKGREGEEQGSIAYTLLVWLHSSVIG